MSCHHCGKRPAAVRVAHAHGVPVRDYCSEVCARSDCPARVEPFFIADIEEEMRRDDYYASTLYASDMEVKKIVLVERGVEIRTEAHENAAQAFFITEGRARFIIGCGKESIELGERGLFLVPRNTLHRVVNVSDGPTRILSLYQNRQHPLGLVYKQASDVDT